MPAFSPGVGTPGRGVVDGDEVGLVDGDWVGATDGVPDGELVGDVLGERVIISHLSQLAVDLTM